MADMTLTPLFAQLCVIIEITAGLGNTFDYVKTGQGFVDKDYYLLFFHCIFFFLHGGGIKIEDSLGVIMIRSLELGFVCGASSN